MNQSSLSWAVPAILLFLFGSCLALMVALPTIPPRHDVLLDSLSSALHQVDQLSDSFMEVGSEQRHSVAALARQGQQVGERLAALGRMPGQAALSARVRGEFDDAFRQAMQARLAVAQAPQDPIAALAAAQPFFAPLQGDLQHEYMAAQGRWFDRAELSAQRQRRALGLALVGVALVSAGLAFLLRRAQRGLGGRRRRVQVRAL